jgi:ArsR family transcriptional regulator
MGRPQADPIFRAFSARTRLRILHLLLYVAMCVCDLVKLLGAPQPTAWRHLASLRRSGLVVARGDGWCKATPHLQFPASS